MSPYHFNSSTLEVSAAHGYSCFAFEDTAYSFKDLPVSRFCPVELKPHLSAENNLWVLANTI